MEPAYLAGSDVIAGIRLESFVPGHALIYPRHWPALLRLTLKNGKGQVVPRRPEFFGQIDESMAVNEFDTSVHSATVRVRFRSLPPDRYHLDVDYDEHHASTFWSVVRGDETPEIEDWKLERDTQRGVDWNEFKRIA